jgi:hypothetical protein
MDFLNPKIPAFGKRDRIAETDIRVDRQQTAWLFASESPLSANLFGC